ncbi:MAG: RNA methyltransferase [Kiritimatiellae bacterium]|nr:RNA methyltransferase [Kiritimatiellia bacterium]
MELTSTSNPKLKHIVKLRSCSVREEAGEMIVEGYRECRRALDHGYKPFAIFHCPEFYLKNENEDSIVGECVKLGAEVYTCSKQCFTKIAYKERPDGLLMVGPHVTVKLEDLVLPENALVVVTEAIEKPGNLGTILRSADAAGVSAVIVCNRTTDIHNPNVVRASTGTLFSVPVAEATSEEALAFLKSRNFKILAATPHAEELHFQVPLTGNVAVALGAEQYGLGKAWMNGADLRVRIPMLGIADSLNVSAAATIMLYEAVRQRIAAGVAEAPAFEPWHGENVHDK